MSEQFTAAVFILRGDATADKRTGQLGGTRVLVVEDEYYLADDLSRALFEAGADVVGPLATLADAGMRVAV